MSAPETDWVDGIIPPAPHWRVVHRYLGLSSRRIFDTPDACFASDGICRRIYARHPINEPAFHYRPFAVPNAQSADPADAASGGDGHADAITDRDHHFSAVAANRDCEHGDGSSAPPALRGDNGGGGSAQDVPMADRNAAGQPNGAGTIAVCDADCGAVLHEGGVDA